MSAIDEILAGIDTDQLAAALGTDPDTAVSAASAVIPTLINSLQANAGSDEGQASLLEALGQHVDGAYGDRIDLTAVDTEDGRRILAHALADDPARLQAVSGLGGNLLSKLLPLLAPIVMSYIARKLGMGGGQSRQGSGDILGDLLGGILGGGAAGSGAGGGGLGDLLGGMLGGGSSGGLGDLLGGMLGGQPEPATVPSGYDTGSAGYGGGTAGRDGDLGGVFNAPGNPTGMQIPAGGGNAYPQQQQQQQGGGDILGDLLGQILGR